MATHRRSLRLLAVIGTLLLLTLLAAPIAGAFAPTETYIVVFGSAMQADPNRVTSMGGRVVADMSSAGVLVVESSDPAALARMPGVRGIAADRIRFRVPKETVAEFVGPVASATGCATTTASCPQQWDLDRIRVAEAWKTTQGSPAVRVAVLDTGLTSTHEEVGTNYDRASSQSFVRPTPFCSADANTYSSLEDYQGHGTWTATHIAGVNGSQMTGIAPRTTLINVRVLGACGFGYDSWVLRGMYYAGQVGAVIESMSLGGYLCADGVVADSYYCGSSTNVGNDQVVWQAYLQVVNYLRGRGTVVIAAAGNEHVELDTQGRVVSVGSLAACTVGPHPCNDYRGLSEVPGGVPGAVAVAATGRVTAAGGTGETKFGQYGVGRRDQLTYYSSYGARIDVSAPGGARNYNVPLYDCISANCKRLGPSSSTATDNPGDFGAWGVDTSGKLCANCYVYVQGTSMATPQVAGVAALALAARPSGLSADNLVALLRQSVSPFLDPNATPAIASDPTQPTYNYSMNYGGPGIANQLMGTGVIDAARAVEGGVPTPPSGTIWSPWTTLGGVLTDAPAAATLNGRVYVFAKGSDNALYVKSSADGALWTDWSNLGGVLTDAPAATNVNGILYVFAKGSDNALYVKRSADGGIFSDWTRLGGVLTAPPAAASLNGTVYVFARGTGNALYVMSSTDGMAWTDWRGQGGVLTSAPAATSFAGQVWVFARGTDNTLYEKHSADGVTWTDWRGQGGVLTAAPAAASYTPAGSTETLYLFARGTDNTLYERHTTDGTTFTEWVSLGGQLVGPPAAASTGNRLYLFVRWTDNALWERHTLP